MSVVYRRAVYFSGNVQGVGFRASSLALAKHYPSLSGSAKNLSNRQVEIIAEGEKQTVLSFYKHLEETLQKYIQGSEVKEAFGPALYSDFAIHYDERTS